MAYQTTDGARAKNGKETRLAPGTSEDRSIDVLLSVQQVARIKIMYTFSAFLLKRSFGMMAHCVANLAFDVFMVKCKIHNFCHCGDYLVMIFSHRWI